MSENNRTEITSTTPDRKTSPLDTFLAHEREMAPHLRAAIEKLSTEHPSGISRAQHDTPMMKQYIASKEEVPDAIVFFRMGDFFEFFGADAVIVADICGLTLTSRDKNSSSPIPMAGVPVVSHRAAIKKCVLAGFKVAVVDQVEDPRSAKGLVRREIVRIATPAVPGDLGDEEADQSQGCYLASAFEGKNGWTLAYIDVSTGEFRITGQLDRATLQQEISTISPREVLVKSDFAPSIKLLLKELFQRVPTVSPIETWVFRSEKDCLNLISDFFGNQAHHRFGIANFDGGIETVAGILSYLKSTQRDVLRNIKSISTYELANHLLLCDSTKRHLDFFFTASGEKRGSLFWYINRCATAAGVLILSIRLNYPFNKRQDIENTLNSVASIVNCDAVLETLATTLRSTADIERLVSRAAQQNLDPRGMVWLRHSISQIPQVTQILNEIKHSTGTAELKTSLGECSSLLQPLTELLWNALDDEPAGILGKGGKIFRPGYSSELDELIAIEQNFDDMIVELEKKERNASGISTLKIGYTRVFGYYFEVSKGKTGQVPAHFIRKQTLTTGERYTTPELKELEDKAVTATERKVIVERELFEALRTKILEHVEPLHRTATLFAEIDVLRNFATLAIQNGWCMPIIVDEATTALENSVHPILKSMQTTEEIFISNNVLVGKSNHPLVMEMFPNQEASNHASILLITGPNMAGKSTIMRQVALTQILCQIGSFVPATRAVIGVSDRIFTRIGSADYALRNQSTFMVEMLECAHMMRLATSQSLLLMDELGRGTSTYDGLSLAWAILEDIHDRIRSRTLFSTHYHELLAVCETHKHIAPMQMEVIERERKENLGAGNREILFSRKFVPGAAGKSFGLHVAELAGIQPSVVGRASEILFNLTGSPLTKSGNAASSAPCTESNSSQTPTTTKKFRKRADKIPEGSSIFDFTPYTIEN